MKRAVSILVLLCAACGGAPPPSPEEPAPSPVGPPTPAPTPAATADTPSAMPETEPAAPSREAREKRVIELLEGKVPQPDLPTDSGGG